MKKASDSNADQEEIDDNHGDKAIPVNQIAILFRLRPVGSEKAVVVETRI